MEYQFDVFLSYLQANPLSKEWVDQIFFPLFEPLLGEAMNDDVRIFKDTEQIKGGMNWKRKIKQALAHSKIMVPVFVPNYFRSEWCMREFAVMLHRQRQLFLSDGLNPNSLIVPIKIFDGEYFPAEASDMQIFNCNNYFRIGEAMKYSPIYIELQGKIMTWVNDVASAIKQAPKWDSTWELEEWLDQPYENMKISSSFEFKAPKL